MEVLIKSQNGGRLYSNCKLSIMSTRLGYEILDNSVISSIIALNGVYVTDNSALGRYETEERALEILKEIENLDISHNPNIKTVFYNDTLIRVIYQMPKD